MKKTHITYIVSDIGKAPAFEWIATYLNHDQFYLSFILLNPAGSSLQEFLEQHNLPVTVIRCRGKRDWVQAWWKTYRYLRKHNPDIIHCHLLTANIIGLSAGKMAGIKKRIYTRHHASLHHIYHPKGIIWDKLANRQATDIIAISGNVKKILVEWEHVPVNKIHEIPHGFLLEHFHEVPDERIHAFKQKYHIHQGPLIGVISRFTEWKGVQYIIPAFKKLLHDNPKAVLLLLNARGDYAAPLKDMLSNLPENSYRIIPFEQDIAAALHSMDVFIHVPIDSHSEAFGQIYIEALAAKVPSVFTLSGIATDFIVNEKNALTVAYRDSDAIFAAMQKIISDPDLRSTLVKEGWNDIKDRFNLQTMILNLQQLYAAE